MMKYETTAVDLEAGVGDVYQPTVVAIPVKSSNSWIWKTIAAIVFLGLCATASFFFAWHLMKQDKGEIQIFESGKQISTPSEHGKIRMQIAESIKAAIHLHGKQESGSLKWASGVDQSFMQGGLKLKDNEIHIPADGLYFVYSQVSYAVHCKLNEDNAEDGPQKHLSHSIWRYSDAMGPERMPLQNSVQSVCQSGENEKTTYSTVYLGAVFKLLEGDKLSTKTSKVTDIEENYAKTFFGVFAL
ncbi:tumor necrosis factor-like [Myxocyprinus asiaticus]|uniref:tumor necrosis factor-like n=1 Tax=Myxocyprinus asiaticus TaxID=70543 RepID=UPI002221933E|nr:tumor necrosis factor-like [Myxocyprinus asiaticus]